MTPMDGNQSDVILVTAETPSKLPRTGFQALETAGGSCQLEPEQPGSVWSLWEGQRGAPGALRSHECIKQSLLQGLACEWQLHPPQRTALPSFHSNYRETCALDPSQPHTHQVTWGCLSYPPTLNFFFYKMETPAQPRPKACISV